MQKKIAFDPLLPSPTLVRVTKPLSVLSALGQGYGVGWGGGWGVLEGPATAGH